MLKPISEKVHLSVNVDSNYFSELKKITPKEALLIIKAVLKDYKDILDTNIMSYNDNGNPKVILHLSEVINAGIENSHEPISPFRDDND